MPDHHLPEELLMSYAAGVASEPHALLCAVHLTLCESCRADLALYEDLGGALLDASPATSGAGTAPVAPVAVTTDDGALPDGADAWPRALHPYVRGKRWSWQSPGIHVLTTELFLSEMPVRLFRLAPSQKVPHHTHDGAELSLVLTGGYVDSGEHYGRGDVACRDGNDAHELAIDPDGECVTLAINEHPLVPLTLAGKLYSVLRKP